VISNPAVTIFRSPAKRARLLALLLLGLLAWGSTAEFNHHHNGKAGSGKSRLSTTQVQNAGDSLFVTIESRESTSTSSNSKTSAVCLICQLHHNLSATALGHTPGVGTEEAHRLNPSLSVFVQQFEFTASCQGRAPPSNL
jgi:hypothetical protein